MEIEALLAKIEQLAPRFGRASSDLAAVVTRGRGGDYKGVMQGCRLVLEMLLRAMVTTELKQTPGKAMLDELISKFRQQSNAGVIPANVLAHMGTVQAWGNLSSHDHAGSLMDEGVQVGPEEVATSLNSMVAILGWYAAKYPGSEAPKAAARDGASAGAATASAGRSQRLLAAAGLLGACGLAAAAAFVAFRGPAASSRLALDAFYVAAREPVPPLPCRTKAPVATLAAAATHLGDELSEAQRAKEGEQALTLLGAGAADPSPEHAYFLARAQLQAGKSPDAALAVATACEGFAAAENLAGKVALQAEKVGEADAHFGKAISVRPDFLKPRYNRALIRLKRQQYDEAIALLAAVVADDPSSADGNFWLAVGYEAKGKAAEAKAAYCKALELGKAIAADRCKR